MKDDFGLNSIPIVISPFLPVVPSDGENARRQVRHGLADVLEWLGEEVGPKPGVETHILISRVGGGVVWVSPSMATNLKQKFLREAS